MILGDQQEALGNQHARIPRKRMDLFRASEKAPTTEPHWERTPALLFRTCITTNGYRPHLMHVLQNPTSAAATDYTYYIVEGSRMTGHGYPIM